MGEVLVGLPDWKGKGEQRSQLCLSSTHSLKLLDTSHVET